MLQRLNPVVFLQRSLVRVAIDAQDSIVIILSRRTTDENDDTEEEREKRLRESRRRRRRRSRGRTSARPHGSSERRASAAMCDAPGGFWIDLVRGGYDEVVPHMILTVRKPEKLAKMKTLSSFRNHFWLVLID
jgi:hypothetical protein